MSIRWLRKCFINDQHGRPGRPDLPNRPRETGFFANCAKIERLNNNISSGILDPKNDLLFHQVFPKKSFISQMDEIFALRRSEEELIHILQDKKSLLQLHNAEYEIYVQHPLLNLSRRGCYTAEFETFCCYLLILIPPTTKSTKRATKS